MAANHTPGPWIVEIEEHRAPHGWFAGNVYSGDPRNGTYRSVARVPTPEPAWSDEKQAEAEADARLIGAAPDLLAALERMLSVSGVHATANDARCDTCLAVSQSLDAIAKARGEAAHA